MPAGDLSRLPRGARLLALLWLLQVAWLGWWFAPESRDAGQRLLTGRWGEAVRLEDPFYRWLYSLKAIIPPDAAYVFVDRYEAGQDIMARYVLHPRRFHRFLPTAPPVFLFNALIEAQASYLIIRDGGLPPQWDFLAHPGHPAFTPVPASGPALIYRVDYPSLVGGFHD